MSEPYRLAIQNFVNKAYNKANIGSISWSACYHYGLGISGVLGIIIATISQVTFSGSFFGFNKDMIISILSLIAAILTFLCGFSNVERKWRANRVYREKLAAIKIDLEEPNANLKLIREELRKASIEHNSGIIPPNLP